MFIPGVLARRRRGAVDGWRVEYTWRPSLLLSLPALNDLMYGKFVIGWRHVSFSTAASSRVFIQFDYH